MEALKLNTVSRTIKGKQVKQLRAEKKIPAVVYGHGVASRDVTVDYPVFEKLLEAAGESSLVDLSVDNGAPVKVLIQEVQYEPLTGKISHVDFRQVKMTEKLEADIEFNLIGEAPAVKEAGGILVHSLRKIPVRCLPQYLVPSIDIDISGLKQIHDSIKVKDIPKPEGMEFLVSPNSVIVVVNEPISEAELQELEAKPEADVAAVKVEGEEKKKAEAEAAAAAGGEEKEKKEKKA